MLINLTSQKITQSKLENQEQDFNDVKEPPNLASGILASNC